MIDSRYTTKMGHYWDVFRLKVWGGVGRKHLSFLFKKQEEKQAVSGYSSWDCRRLIMIWEFLTGSLPGRMTKRKRDK